MQGQRPPGPSGGQAQIVCSGCRTVLLYPSGAQNVRCARCSTITSVPPPAPAPAPADMAQLCCSNAQCRVVLMYPRGAGQVQCSVCGNLNDATQANQLGHVVCGGCQITLAFAWGAQSVKCAVCSYVTPVGSAAVAVTATHTPAAQQQQQGGPSGSGGGSSGQQAGGGGGGGKPPTTVLVEHPGGLDEAGNEVPSSIAVGVSGADKLPS